MQDKPLRKLKIVVSKRHGSPNIAKEEVVEFSEYCSKKSSSQHSTQIQSILQNQYSAIAAKERQEQERVEYLDRQFLQQHKPIFKNFIHNNSSIRRKEHISLLQSLGTTGFAW